MFLCATDGPCCSISSLSFLDVRPITYALLCFTEARCPSLPAVRPVFLVAFQDRASVQVSPVCVAALLW